MRITVDIGIQAQPKIAPKKFRFIKNFELESSQETSICIETIRSACIDQLRRNGADREECQYFEDVANKRRFGLWLLDDLSEELSYMMNFNGDDIFPLQLPGKWLDDKKTLDDLLIHPGYKLLFKNKIERLPIKTLDDIQKTQLVDFSKEVKKVVKDACYAFQIKNPTEYLFCIDEDQINALKKTAVDMNAKTDMSTLKTMNSTMNRSQFNTMKSNQTMNRSRLESTLSTSGIHDGTAHKNKETIVTKSKNKLKKMADRNFTKLQSKLITDDKIEWLNPSETLASELYRYRELLNMFGENEHNQIEPVVVLRRRYFFSDANVEERDPKQLILLYKQCVKSVISGEYSVTREKALQLAGYQAKVDFGRFRDANKQDGNKKAFVDELIPQEIIGKGNKSVNKLYGEILKEWENEQIGIEKQDSQGEEVEELFKSKWQKQYIKVCRSMPTYGVTCFLVKEKERGKNRMKPRLLGISKTSVIRLTEDKEIEFEYPLESIKNWAAGTNNVTLNFGDYKDLQGLDVSSSTYSVKTKADESEKIIALINGYIQIILEQRKGGDKFDDGSANWQKPHIANNAPSKAKTYSEGQKAQAGVRGEPAIPGISYTGHDPKQIVKGELQGAQRAIMNPNDPNLPQAKQPRLIPFQTSVAQNLDDLPEIQMNLMRTVERADSDDYSDEDIEFNKHKINAHCEKVAESTAQIVNKFPNDNDQSLAPAVDGLVSELKELPEPIRALAALSLPDEEKSGSILNAANDLLQAVSKLLKSSQETDQDLSAKKRSIQSAAIEVSEALGDVLNCVRSSSDDSGQRLVELASKVPFATQELVKNVQEVIQGKSDADLSDISSPESKLIVAATKTAHAASQLVTVAKVTAPTIHDTGCQKQLTDAMKDVSVAINNLVLETDWLESNDRNKLKDATGKVSLALEALINHMKKIVTPSTSAEKYSDLSGQAQNLPNIHDPEERIAAVKDLAQQYVGKGGLVHALKLEGDDATDSNKRDRLHAAAKNLMQATQGVVEAARSMTQNGSGDLDQAARELAEATEAGIRLREKRATAKSLIDAAKQAASAATQMVAPVRAGTRSNNNAIQANNLNIHNKAMQKQVPELIKATKQLEEKPESSIALNELVEAAKKFAPPAQRTVGASKSAQPTVADPSAKALLRNATEKLATAINKLVASSQRAAELCESSPLDNACDKVGDVVKELGKMKQDAENGRLKLGRVPAHSEDLELGKAVKQSIAVVPQVLSAAANSDETALNGAATAASDAAVQLKDSVKYTIATESTVNADTVDTIKCGHQVADSIQRLLFLCRDERENDSPDKKNKLLDMAKELTSALSDMFNCIPGQREIEDSHRMMKNATDKFDQLAQRSQPVGTYSAAARDLKIAAEDTNQAAGNVVGAASGELQDVVLASQEYAQDYERLVEAGIKVASHTTGSDRQDVIDEMREVSAASSKLLNASKDIATDMGNSGYRVALSSAAKGVTDAINDLISKCVAAAPGQASCESAIRKLNNAKAALNTDILPTGAKKDYFAILNDIITEHSRSLGNSMKSLYQHAKEQNSEAFSQDVDATTNTLLKLTDEASAAAYIVGVSDQGSIPGKEGVVDQVRFQECSKGLFQALDDIAYDSSQDKLMAAVTAVAKQTTNLCSMCATAADKVNRPEQRNQFKQGARELGQATTDLVAKFRSYSQDPNEDRMGDIGSASVQLKQVTNNLSDFASSPEFSNVAPQLSSEAKEAQLPIIEAGKTMLDGGSEMIDILKNYIQNPKMGVEVSLHAASRKVSESIKKMIQAIREAAPGQKECDDAISSINDAFRELNNASMDAMSHGLDGESFPGTFQSHTKELNHLMSELDSSISPVAKAAKSEAVDLGRGVTQMASLVGNISLSTVSAASKLPISKQDDLISYAKTVLENLLQLVYSAKESGGNPKIKTAHTEVDKACTMLRETIVEFQEEINVSPASTANNLINVVEQSVNGLTNTADITKLSQNQLQTNLTKECRELAQISQSVSTASAAEIPELQKDSVATFQRLCNVSTHAHKIADSEVAANSIQGKTRTCGSSLVDMINASLIFSEDPSDSNKRDLHEKCRKVADAVKGIMEVLSVSSASAKATQKLTSKIESIRQDVETDILFAQSGTLALDIGESFMFEDLMCEVAKFSRMLTEDIRSLVQAVESSDNSQLTQACESSGESIDRLTDTIRATSKFIAKEGPEAQVALLNVTKGLVAALSDLINATRVINGQFSEENVGKLKSSSTETVRNVTRLIQTVQVIREDQSRGPAELMSSISAIENFSAKLKHENVQVVQGGSPEPEAVIAATKPLTMAASRAVAVGKKGNTTEIISLCSVSVDVVDGLVRSVVTNAAVTPSDKLRSELLDESFNIIGDYKCALTALHDRLVNADVALESQISLYSQRVASGIARLSKTALRLKGDDWEDPNDPNVIAEKELLRAANAIEAAASKLSNLTPRKEANSKADENLNFDEQILDAAKSIALATKLLVQKASTAQKELVLEGRLQVTGVSKDKTGQFSQGLVSAAQMVARETGSMCEAANDLVKGEASEEKLEAAAQGVSTATGQLLIACKVKAEPDSEAMKRLDQAGAGVRKAAENLVKASTAARENKNEEMAANFQNKSDFQVKREELKARERLLKAKREMEAAEAALRHANEERYRRQTAEEEEQANQE